MLHGYSVYAKNTHKCLWLRHLRSCFRIGGTAATRGAGGDAQPSQEADIVNWIGKRRIVTGRKSHYGRKWGGRYTHSWEDREKVRLCPEPAA